MENYPLNLDPALYTLNAGIGMVQVTQQTMMMMVLIHTFDGNTAAPFEDYTSPVDQHISFIFYKIK